MNRRFEFGVQYSMHISERMNARNISTQELLELAAEGIEVSKEEYDEIAEANLLSLYVQIISIDYIQNKKNHNEGIERLFQLNEEILLPELFPNIVLPHIKGLIKKLIGNDFLSAIEFIEFCGYLTVNYDNAKIPEKEYNDFLTYFNPNSKDYKAIRGKCFEMLADKYDTNYQFFDLNKWKNEPHKLI